MDESFVYILSSGRNGTLYVGATTDIINRIWDHKQGVGSDFTKKYKVIYLVYYEIHPSIVDAYARETRLKKWKRQWKIELIEKANPDWACLYNSLAM